MQQSLRNDWAHFLGLEINEFQKYHCVFYHRQLLIRISFCREIFVLSFGVFRINFTSILDDFLRSETQPSFIFGSFKISDHPLLKEYIFLILLNLKPIEIEKRINLIHFMKEELKFKNFFVCKKLLQIMI